MLWSCIVLSLMIIKNINGISSPITPFANYTYSVELMANTSDLWWSVDFDKQEITFELHMNTTGWIALGISPAGGMPGADIGVGWVNQTGTVFFQDRHAIGFVTPILDNTTIDWFALQGREQDGWTAIQFKRLLDTCDTMDLPIKSGANTVIFAYGLVDPDPSQSNGDITYHYTRRGQRIIPLQSYTEPPSSDALAGLDTFDFRVNNNTIPTNDSTYFCKVFKTPNKYPDKRHVIAREIMIDSDATDLIHHLTLSECDSTVVFDDNNLPYGNCDDNVTAYALCTFNIAIAWALGGDTLVEYPDDVGFPIGLNFTTKYYMLQIHYYNVNSTANRTDNSGIRFYVGNQLRLYDLGFLTFGTQSSPLALAIPPNDDRFAVDSYCTADAGLYNFPSTGLTIFSAFSHTHLQGISVWTKLIRNKTAVQYLFNDELYNMNYQFEHQLPERIKIYPGDEFATRCVYSTTNKTYITLGGRRLQDEVCLQVFAYYPRLDELYACASLIAPTSWAMMMHVSASAVNETTLSQWLLNITWTPDFVTQWQNFYYNASRLITAGRAGHYNISFLPQLPTYQDLDIKACNSQQTNSSVTIPLTAVTSTIIGRNGTQPIGNDTGTTSIISSGNGTMSTTYNDTTTIPITTTHMNITSTPMMSMNTTNMTTIRMNTTNMTSTSTVVNTNSTESISNNLVIHQGIFFLLVIIPFVINRIFNY